MTPAVAGETVYVGSCAGAYYAWDLRTGELRWRREFQNDAGHATFHGDPLVLGDLLVTGTESLNPPHARAMDLRTGALRWRRDDEWSPTRSDVVAAAGLVIGRNHGGDLVALDPASGELRWHVPGGEARFRADVAESPAVRGSTIFFSAVDGSVVAVNAADGEVRWRSPVACDVSTSVAADEHDLYVGCSDGRIARLRTDDGALVSDTRLPGRPEGRIVLLPDRVIVPGGRQWIGAVDRGLRTMLWGRTPPGDEPFTVVQPLLAGDLLLTGTAGGVVLALDPANGATRWVLPLEGSIRGMGIHADVLLVGTIEGRITALRRPAR